MTDRDDDRFRIRPGPPKARPPRFVSKVVREVSKAAGRIASGRSKRLGARLGRGHAAAGLARRSASPQMRRVTIKTRLVNLRRAGARSTQTHLRYLERDGIGPHGGRGRAYGPDTDEADLTAFEERGRGDRHQFRFIVSAEEGEQVGDLRCYTRTLMSRMESDLGTRLEWVAVDHWDTDNPHTHIVLRGRDDLGRDLVIAGDYLAHGMRGRASDLATELLGPRTKREIEQGREREVGLERWTGLDRALQREVRDGAIRFDRPGHGEASLRQRTALIGRLQTLERLGLATEQQTGVWSLREDAERVLRAMGERGDIVRTMQRAMGAVPCELAVFDPTHGPLSVVGRVVGKGLADELHERGYLVLDGVDGRAHHVTLGTGIEPGEFPVGAIVEARVQREERAVDEAIAARAVDGIYRLEAGHGAEHDSEPACDPATTTAHVRRLEALRRAGVVERINDGVWRVPADLPARGREYDRQRSGGTVVEMHSHLPVERQVRAIGATWLDRQLVGGNAGIGDSGFGGEVREALRQRTDFLVEQGLGERRGQRVVLARNLLATLRSREIETVARSIAAETGLMHRPLQEGERVTGEYRRSVMLASGRFAMLNDGQCFSLVPWRPVIAKRIGQTLTAENRSAGVSWSFGRQRGPAR